MTVVFELVRIGQWQNFDFTLDDAVQIEEQNVG
jgi:hypothetical protein